MYDHNIIKPNSSYLKPLYYFEGKGFLNITVKYFEFSFYYYIIILFLQIFLKKNIL